MANTYGLVHATSKITLETHIPAKMKNVVLSAHVGHFSDASMARRPVRFGEEIARVFLGEMPINLVNSKVNEKLQLRQ